MSNSKKILHLTSSIQGKQSYSIKLGKKIVEKIQAKYPDSTIEEVNLVELNLSHLTPTLLQALFTPAEFLTDEQKTVAQQSNDAIAQVTVADIIVIGAPLYNFTIHSALKSWIDHITRPKITFGYGADGRPVGLINGKKVYVAMTSGGIFSEGAGKENDFVAPYLKAFLGFLGMTDLTVFRAEGLKVPGIMETAMEKAIESISID